MSNTVEIVNCNPNFDFVNKFNGLPADYDQWSSKAPTYDLAKKACLNHFATTDQPQEVWMQYYNDQNKNFNCSRLKNPTSTDKPVKTHSTPGMLCTTQRCSLDDYACLSKNMLFDIQQKLGEAKAIESVYTETSCSKTDVTCMAKACENKGLTFLSNNHFSNQGTTYALCGKTHITKDYSDCECSNDRDSCIQKECNEHGLSMSGYQLRNGNQTAKGLCTPTGYDIISTQFHKRNDGRHPPTTIPGILMNK